MKSFLSRHLGDSSQLPHCRKADSESITIAIVRRQLKDVEEIVASHLAVFVSTRAEASAKDAAVGQQGSRVSLPQVPCDAQGMPAAGDRTVARSQPLQNICRFIFRVRVDAYHRNPGVDASKYGKVQAEVNMWYHCRTNLMTCGSSRALPRASATVGLLP